MVLVKNAKTNCTCDHVINWREIYKFIIFNRAQYLVLENASLCYSCEMTDNAFWKWKKKTISIGASARVRVGTFKCFKKEHSLYEDKLYSIMA